ncbi:glycoside hydrolase family 3 N-terminal domain-containing protein [Methylocapsa aurea]|uniref:glycoside hydrolase family 3 N-terminal domain-containing protein n=1 Tax=Methylocapsa aurea TaxID=663610 RepID=UPI000565D717|nr:glycoside hydrolase family 3 protein [Methylocapsa aurea]
MLGKSIAAVGDHFLVGLRPSPVLHDLDRALLADLRPAGVILYKSNFRHDLPYEAWLESHARLVEEIRAATGRPRMFIAIDHEGGRVCRTPPPITRFSYAARWAEQAADVGRAMGRELAALGVNLNFAPVLDIHTNPNNPVIGERAFGTTAEAVIAAALPFIQAMESEKVMACGKHFPGHGDTSIDSHLGLPSLGVDADALRARELRPFAAAIEAGVSMLMTSHILFPAIDPNAPVTLSRRFGTEILRTEMGFAGVVVSDDIGMGAMKGFFDAPEAAASFLAAGSDMLMVCAHFTDSGRARNFAEAIVRALDEGRLDAAELARSRARIEALLDRAPMNEVHPLPEGAFRAHGGVGTLFAEATVEVV